MPQIATYPPPTIQPEAPGRNPADFEKSEARVRLAEREAVKAGGELDNDTFYSLVGGLQRANNLTLLTRFGTIQDRIRYRLERMPPHERLSILTIGAGRGIMEAETKALFGDRVEIDTFSLTSQIDPKNRDAIRHEYLGNIDYQQIPRGTDAKGYDSVISTNATQWVEDQEFAAMQIAQTLRVGGEATFTVRTRSPLFAQIEGLHRDGTIMKFGGLFLSSGRLADNRISQVYMERTGEEPFDFGAFLTAKPAADADGTFYQLTRAGDWQFATTKGDFVQTISDMVEGALAYLGSEGFPFSDFQRARFLKNVLTDVRYAKYPIDEAVEGGISRLIYIGTPAYHHRDDFAAHRRRTVEVAARRAALRQHIHRPGSASRAAVSARAIRRAGV